MVFFVYSELWNHYHFLISEHFYKPKETLCTLGMRDTPFPLTPSPKQLLIYYFCPCGFAYLDIPHRWKYAMCGLLWLDYFSLHVFKVSVSHVSIIHYFLLPNNTPLYECYTFCFFIHLLVCIFFDCYTALNIHTHVSVFIFDFSLLVYMARDGISGYNTRFNFVKNCHSILQRGRLIIWGS